MIIDIHTHLNNPFDKNKADEFIRKCDINGIAVSVVSNLGNWEPFPTSDAIREYNDKVAIFAEDYPDKIKWFAYINPQNDDSQAEMERCEKEGAVGIKLWISLKDDDGGTENTEKVFRKAAALDLPCLTHCYHRTTANLKGELNLVEIARIAEKVPQTTIIAAHINANWAVTKGIMRNSNSNFLVDLSGCYPEAGIVEEIVDEIGADRILFGSDFTGRSLPSQIAKVALANISDADKEQILWKNAAKLLQINNDELTISTPIPDITPSPDRALDVSKDYFVFCGDWAINPKRTFTPTELEKILDDNDITEAYTASLSAVLSFDLQYDNAKFIESAKGINSLKPLATVNPEAYNWNDVIDSGIGCSRFMLHPYLHNWNLSDAKHDEFFKKLKSTCKPIFINLEFGDDRFKHYTLNTRPVASSELTEFAEKNLDAKCVFQGAKPNMIDEFLTENQRPNFRFEISRLTDISWALSKIVNKYGTENLVLGSEFPLREMGETRFALNKE